MRITLGIESFTWHLTEESLVSINIYSSKKTDISILSVTDIWLLKKNLKLNTIFFWKRRINELKLLWSFYLKITRRMMCKKYSTYLINSLFMMKCYYQIDAYFFRNFPNIAVNLKNKSSIQLSHFNSTKEYVRQHILIDYSFSEMNVNNYIKILIDLIYYNISSLCWMWFGFIKRTTWSFQKNYFSPIHENLIDGFFFILEWLPKHSFSISHYQNLLFNLFESLIENISKEYFSSRKKPAEKNNEMNVNISEQLTAEKRNIKRLNFPGKISQIRRGLWGNLRFGWKKFFERCMFEACFIQDKTGMC